MDKQSFISAIEQICEEKGISKEKVIETIEMAIAAAYKRDYGRKGQNIKVKFDAGTGKMEIFQVKLVVDESMLKTEEEIEEEKAEKAEDGSFSTNEETEEGEKKFRFNPEKHIMIEEAKKTQKSVKPGETLEFPLEVTAGSRPKPLSRLLFSASEKRKETLFTMNIKKKRAR